MTGLDERARRAAAAVQARTADLPSDDGLEAVVRRGRRPRPTTVLAVLLIVALAVPGVGWLRDLAETRVQLESPAATPTPDTGADDDGEPGDRDEETGALVPAPTVEPEVERETPTPPAQSSSPPPSPAAAPSLGPEPAGPFADQAVTGGNFPTGGGALALLTDLRVASQPGFDRVVLQLQGPDMPSYRVSPADPPLVQDGSGEPIVVAGAAFLEVQLAPASGVDASGVEPVATYEGPSRISVDSAVVTEVVRTADFEGHLTWVIGLRSAQPFAVTVLSDPLRLVVDIAVQ